MPSHHDFGIDNEAFCGGTPDDEPAPRRADAWTKQPPTQDGYYWHRENIASKAVVRFVSRGIVRYGAKTICPAAEYGGEWWGPLQQPGGATVD